MAKKKSYMVTITEVVTHSVLVDARSVSQAESLVKTPEGYREATKYCYDETMPYTFDPKTMNVVSVRQI